MGYKLFRHFKFWLPVGLYAVLIFYLSSIPLLEIVEEIPMVPPWFVLHVIEFLFFGILLFRAFKSTLSSYSKTVSLTIFIGTFYGITDEIHQHFVFGRFCTIEDVVADALGVIFGCVIAIVFLNEHKRHYQTLWLGQK